MKLEVTPERAKAIPNLVMLFNVTEQQAREMLEHSTIEDMVVAAPDSVPHLTKKMQATLSAAFKIYNFAEKQK